MAEQVKTPDEDIEECECEESKVQVEITFSRVDNHEILGVVRLCAVCYQADVDSPNMPIPESFT